MESMMTLSFKHASRNSSNVMTPSWFKSYLRKIRSTCNENSDNGRKKINELIWWSNFCLIIWKLRENVGEGDKMSATNNWNGKKKMPWKNSFLFRVKNEFGTWVNKYRASLQYPLKNESVSKNKEVAKEWKKKVHGDGPKCEKRTNFKINLCTGKAYFGHKHWQKQ